MKILYVEDDDEQRKLLSTYLKKHNYDFIEADNPVKGIEIIKNESINLIISDFKMPEMNGYEFMTEVKKINPLIRFIIVTAYADINLAIKTIKNGAEEFITKPIKYSFLLEKVKEVEETFFVETQVDKIKNEYEEKVHIDFPNIIGKSEALKTVLSKVPTLATTDLSVIICGESGTGKELIADLVQVLSDRKDKPFIKVNCAAIPDSLLESEFFGYEKGAFTGANKRKIGIIESADKGTLFLDEIGELPYNMQGKLLRFLQNSEIIRIGSSKPIKVDVRIVSATNKNLEKLIGENKFRKDLFFRLNNVTLKMPSLKDRKEDIPLLIEYFLDKYSKLNNSKEKKVISNPALDKLMKYDFQGNIRELENIIQYIVLFSRKDIINTQDIPILDSEHEEVELPDDCFSLKEYIEIVERNVIVKELDRNDWIRRKTAEKLQIDESVLRYKMRKYDIKSD